MQVTRAAADRVIAWAQAERTAQDDAVAVRATPWHHAGERWQMRSYAKKSRAYANSCKSAVADDALAMLARELVIQTWYGRAAEVSTRNPFHTELEPLWLAQLNDIAADAVAARLHGTSGRPLPVAEVAGMAAHLTLLPYTGR